MTTSGRSWEELKKIKSCGVFFVPDAIYVVSAARTIPGFCVDCEPVFKVSIEGSPSALGDAVLSALNAFRLDVPPPSPEETTFSPLLSCVGKKSWKEIERVARHVTVSLDENKVSVIPTERDPRNRGYMHRPDLSSQCIPDAGLIGVALLGVLEHCS